MNTNIKQLLITANLAMLSSSALAAADDWSVRTHVGLSQMSDLRVDFADIDGLSGAADIALDSGFAAGLGIAYHYTDNIALELGWEYRSNDSAATLANISEFDEGNYASNIFYLNGHYVFGNTSNWQPYVGAGLLWAQEIDIDLERNGQELSYSGDGDTGYQVFAGINYQLSEKLALQSELRYGSISNIALDGESKLGQFESIDYETTTLQLGLKFDF